MGELDVKGDTEESGDMLGVRSLHWMGLDCSGGTHRALDSFLPSLIHIYIHVYMPAGQKRTPDFIMDGCKTLCGCWEPNSGPLG